MRPFALALAVLAALPAFAEDKADIKPAVKKGLKFTRTSEIKGDGECKIEIGTSGMSIPIEAKMEYNVKHVEEVLDVKDGRPVDLHRAYPTRASAISLGIYGAQSESHPLEGADITCKGGIWVVVSGGLAEEAGKVISKERAVDPLTDAISSGKVVILGNTWDGDKAKLKAWFESEFPGFEADEKESEMGCKLGEFREKDGHKCARVEVDAKVKGKIALQNAPSSEVTITLEGDVFYSLESGVVIAVKGKGSLKAELEIKGQDQDGKAKLDVPLEWNVTVKVGEAAFDGAKPTEKPKKETPEFYPDPLR